MSAMLEELEAQALKLPPGERSELVQRLLISLDGEPEDSSEEVAKAWDEEIARRVVALDSGTAVLIPSEDVFAEIDIMLKRTNR